MTGGGGQRTILLVSAMESMFEEKNTAAVEGGVCDGQNPNERRSERDHVSIPHHAPSPLPYAFTPTVHPTQWKKREV